MVSKEDGRYSWDHLTHSSIGSIEKARRSLDYQPRYSSPEAVQEALAWLKASKL